MSRYDSGFRGIGEFVGFWAIEESWRFPTSHCDCGFRGVGEDAGLWANKESWGSQEVTVIVVFVG